MGGTVRAGKAGKAGEELAQPPFSASSASSAPEGAEGGLFDPEDVDVLPAAPIPAPPTGAAALVEGGEC